MKPNLTLEQMQPFCSTDPTRFAINKPFTRGEHTYATDGRVAIRIPKIDGVPEEPTVDAAKVFMFSVLPEKPILLPDILPAPLKHECKECRGSGRLSECKKCDGEGTVVCDFCDAEHECKECDGEGHFPENAPEAPQCDECDGLGHFFTNPRVDVGGIIFASDLLRLIQGLPDSRLFFDHPLSPARFTFTGGEGVVMPCRSL